MALPLGDLYSLRAEIKSNPSAFPPQREYFNETLNDRWIAEYIFPGKTGGYFVEAGAANGKAASSCYVLEQDFQWRGICIEPNPDFAKFLVENRPNSVHEQVCLSDKIEQVSFVFADGDPYVAPYLNGIKENLENYKWDGKKVTDGGTVTQMDAVPLADLLRKHNAPKVIDYAAFDIEGSELTVLESFPFDEYRFLAMSVESDEWVWERMFKRLSSLGYREVSNPFSSITWEKYCVHEDIWHESFGTQQG